MLPRKSYFYAIAYSGVLISTLLYYIYNSPIALLWIDSQLSAIQGNASAFNLHHHAYLQGIFQPVPHETFDLCAEIISGTILPELDGLYLYNGPNPTMRQLDRGYHFFDGHGFVRLLRLDSAAQTATFSAQYLNTHAYNFSKVYDQNVFVNLGEVVGIIGLLKLLVVQPSLYHALHVTQLQSVTANTAFVHDQHQHRFYATHEAGLPFCFHIAKDTLRIISDGFQTLNGALNYEFPAHTKTDPGDQSIYFYGHSLDPSKSAYKVGKWDASGIQDYHNVDSYYRYSHPSTKKDDSARSFSHDLLMTENYIVILESSVVFDPMKILSSTGEFFFNFDAQRPFRIGLVPKHSHQSTHWITLERPLSIIHTLNAWEERDSTTGEPFIVLHSPISDYFNAFDPRNLSLANYFELAELRISLSTNQTKITYYSSYSTNANAEAAELRFRPQVEFPSVHPDYVGRPCRYGYLGQFDDLSVAGNRPGFAYIAQVDMFQRRFISMISLPSDMTALEPCVIPKNPTSEARHDDDHSNNVYIAAYTYDHQLKESYFYVFDGTSMSSIPVLVVRLAGQRVNFGFHGLWVANKALQAHYQAYYGDGNGNATRNHE